MRISALLLAGTAAIAFAAPAFAQTDRGGQAQAANAARRRQPTDEEIIVTATKRASTRPGRALLDQCPDRGRHPARQRQHARGHQPQRRRPDRPEPRARARARCRSAASRPARSSATSRASRSRSASTSTKAVISLSLFTPDFDLFDLNRVETLRGPQGTLFGSGSVGGTIRYITNQPQLGATEGLVEGERQHGRRTATSAITSRARSTSRWATRWRCARSATARNTAASSMRSARPAARTSMTARASAAASSLLFEPTPDLKITPRVVYQKIEADGFNREEHYNLYRQPVHDRRPATTSASASNI